ncbi:glycosyltransferase family 25 protein [Vibrio barjaei]|uniref:glycosyltransferase family 25 protein n=1 Tax=Vibrio barjaei TaxID=1676683 RepID=UPI000B1F245A|nr:glycosyltransferase family 25 protein [Vibrio barjaei]
MNPSSVVQNQEMRIFVISLPDATERRERVKRIFSETNYQFTFFDAINGREGLPERLERRVNDTYRKVFRSRPLSPGEKGCFASHLLLWEKCLELDEPIVLLEDDFLPTESFENAFSQLPLLIKDIEYLRLEKRTSKWFPINSVGGFERRFLFDNSCGTTGYVLTPQGAQKLLQHSEEWLCAVDNYISESFRHGMYSFNISPPAIEAPHDMGSLIQCEEKTRVPLYFKLTRELNRFYRFVRMTVSNRQFINKLQNKVSD